MVYSREVLVKSEFMSKLPMTLLESWSTIAVTKVSKSLNVYLLVVNNDTEIGFKNFASLYVGVCKADNTCLKGRKSSTCFSCLLQAPYIIPGLAPTSFKYLYVSSDMPLEVESFLQILLMHFSRLIIIFKKSSSFTAIL